ncbi:MAG: glycoside hydrolase family 18 protein [Pirellulales bacterium]
MLHIASIAQYATAADLIGYVPWYRMNSSYNTGTLPAQLALLDEVRYFGLTAASNGTVAPLGGGSGNMATHLNRIATIKTAIAALPEGQRPRLNITLGGAAEAANFATVAGNAGLRTMFAQDIKSLLDQTGATSVDIDWEHPAAGIQRTSHYPAMLARIKQELGANLRVYATVDPTVVINNSVFSGPDAIDGLSLMTYDLGWWGNDPGNPNNGEHSLPEYVEDAVQAWNEPPGSQNDRPWVFGTWGNNAPAAKLGVGLPFYGHTVMSPDATYTFSELATGGTTTDGNYYMYQGKSVWIPSSNLAAQRVQFAHDHGLQHIIIWELGQDVHPDTMHPDPNKRSLLRRAFEKNQSLLGDYSGDRNVDIGDYNVWRSTFGSITELRADGNGNTVVDAADYLIWRDRATGGDNDAATSIAVPEPSIICIGTILGLLSWITRMQWLARWGSR